MLATWLSKWYKVVPPRRPAPPSAYQPVPLRFHFLGIIPDPSNLSHFRVRHPYPSISILLSPLLSFRLFRLPRSCHSLSAYCFSDCSSTPSLSTPYASPTYEDIMGKSIFEKIQARLELFRLEQRYTRRRDRRTTFVSGAHYEDGEYVFQTPASTGSSDKSSRINALHGEKPSAVPVAEIHPRSSASDDDEARDHHDAEWAVPRRAATDVDAMNPTARKRLNRLSSMPAFGAQGDRPVGGLTRKQRRTSMFG